MSRESLTDKRAEVMRLNSRAAYKIKKIAAGTYNPRGVKRPSFDYSGVDISGTPLDPRVNTSHINRMTGKQLDKAIERLREFQSSSVTYYRGVNGSPISRSVLMAARHQAELYNIKLALYKERVKDTKIPWIGEGLTAEDYDRDWRPKNVYLADQPYYEMRPRKMPTPRHFANEQKIVEWTRDMARQNSPEGHAKRLSSVRWQISEMIRPTGDTELQLYVDNLTDDQLWFLWTNDGSLATSLSVKYENAKLHAKGTKSPRILTDKLADIHTSKAREILEYGLSLTLP